MSHAIDKTSFRVFRTSDARTLVEHPQRVDRHGDEPSQMLVISDAGIVVQDRKQAYPTSSNAIVSSHEIMGIVGILELAYGKYLIGITQRTLAATIQAHKVWRIKAGVAIPVGSTTFPAHIEELDDATLAKYATDKDLLDNISSIVNSGHLYYSTSYDLTHSLQHNFLQKTGKAQSTVVDDRYFFNRHLQTALIEASRPSKGDTSPWVAKIIAGFAGGIDIDYAPDAADATAPARTYTIVLVSRLNQRRLGTRYVRRGLDSAGNAANNVEMEQIVFNHDFLKDKSISAYVQIRGSAPSVWGQELDLSYRPRLLLADIDKEVVWSPIKSHYQDLKHQYIGEKSVGGGADHGQVVCVNLLDDTGFEGPLTEIYERTVKRFNDTKITYESFPLNKWCKKMNFKNMEILMDRVRVRLANSGWFVAEGEIPSLVSPGTLRCTRLQTGTARVSCLDSLDRTNLTCSIFARHVVAFQVQSVSPDLPAVQVLPSTGVSPSEVRDPAAAVRKALEHGMPALTNVWADSGDAISLMYAGTRALKADVTRTGKRQVVKGSLDDGMNSLTRYYINNFTDGRRQDAYDLWSGKTTLAKINELVATQGAKQAHRLRKPLLPKNKGLGVVIPSVVIDAVEPFLYATTEYVYKVSDKSMARRTHVDEKGEPHTYAGFLVALMKVYSPAHVNNMFEFFLAMVIFFYVFVTVKIFKIRGQNVVDRPRLTTEEATLRELTN
ncbi:Phosphoinositide phosphatase sac1 [Polyrhizophydium stewartii]|uniref:Phosphoinositide phosphatase sac1 n=1 Tax=Polyrhizophydium stewartii TaxID=2732419 RepID=A0ABR4NKR8_9FUNG|nr:Phosphatidylinositide phosphatase SAC1 [Polyrhizophydium stewartii]